MLRTPKRVRSLWLAIAVCAALAFSSCGRKESAPLSEGGENSPATPGAKPAEATIEQQTEQKLDPLTKEDVELYLKVMHAAAERVKKPTSSDRAALEGAKKILTGSASGRVPTQDDVKTLAQANQVVLSMDQIVADDMKLDGKTYRGIAEAVESVLQSPAPAETASKDGKPVPNHVPSDLENRLSDVNGVNAKFLAPYREEIQKLMAVVHNPANLPK